MTPCMTTKALPTTMTRPLVLSVTHMVTAIEGKCRLQKCPDVRVTNHHVQQALMP